MEFIFLRQSVFNPRMYDVVESTTPGFPREKTACAPELHVASPSRSNTALPVTVEPCCGE